jgi:hypothetical protein
MAARAAHRLRSPSYAPSGSPTTVLSFAEGNLPAPGLPRAGGMMGHWTACTAAGCPVDLPDGVEREWIDAVLQAPRTAVMRA